MAFSLSAAFCLCVLRRTDWLLLFATSFALPVAKGANSVIDPARSVQGFAVFFLEVAPLGAAANLRRQMLIPFSLWSPPISPQPGATGTRDEACRRPSRPPLIVSSVLVGPAVLWLGTAVPSLFQRRPFKRVELGWNDPIRWKHGGLAGWGVRGLSFGAVPSLIGVRLDAAIGMAQTRPNFSRSSGSIWFALLLLFPIPAGGYAVRALSVPKESHNFAFGTSASLSPLL